MTDTTRAARVFSDACELPPAERSAFLEAACGGDAALHAEVASLLAAHDQADTFMGSESQRRVALLAAHPGDTEGLRVGPYRTLRELGRGGMGVVYLAARAEGGFEQKVALKLIKRGMDSEAIVGRFLRERQILAGLAHPSVARLLDGGVTDDGQPYFAMEYIEGTPLTEYCDARGLGIEQRLPLFEEICRAVQHAHGKLVVHRDLKPSNILVGEDGRPRLLDFGVAKLLRVEGSEPAALTQAGDRLLTPDYAAPEQLRGDAPVTTAADVYALGVILYELLTGRRPYELGKGAPGALAQAIEQAVPRPPSLAARTKGDGRLVRRLAGDLDTIVLKALQKEPERRYASAEALADDVRRHLAGQPVRARRDTPGYRASRFVRRHRLGVAAAAVVVVSLVLGLIGTTWQARRAGREARRAQSVQRFLVDVFQSADPTRTLGETVSARQLLDEGARRLRREAGEDPGARAELADTLARTYRSLGLLEDASAWSSEAVAGFHAAVGPGHARAALAELTQAEIRADRGEVAPSRAALEALLPRLRAAFGDASPEHLRAREARAALLAHSGQSEEALAEQRAILAAMQHSLGPDHVETAFQQGKVAAALADQSRFAEAEAAFRDALARIERDYARSPQRVHLETAFAELLDTFAKPDEAEQHFRAALESGRAVLGPRHPQLAQTLIKQGFFLTQRQRQDEAQAALEEAIAILEPLGHYDAGSALRYLGLLHMGGERFSEAHDAFARAETFFRQKVGADHPLTWAAVVTGAHAEARLGRIEEAESRLREAIAALIRLHGERSNDVRVPRKYLGEVLRLARRCDEAEAIHREVLALEYELFGTRENLSIAATKHQLARDLLEAGRHDRLPEARQLADDALGFLRANEPEPMRLGDVLTTSGRIAAAEGDRVRARRDLDEAVRLLASTRGETAPSTRTARQTLQDLGR